jgi:hypothetical protein
VRRLWRSAKRHVPMAVASLQRRRIIPPIEINSISSIFETGPFD